VKRFTIVRDSEHRAASSTKRIGGVHFYGLCDNCNNIVQATWDPAYCEMAKTLWPIATAVPIHLPKRLALPSAKISPGGVARCVLVGCFALNPRMRTVHPDLAAAVLADRDEITLPSDLTLQLALTRGPHARVTGAITGYYMYRPRIDGRNVGIISTAQVYFPPLAWQLADKPASVLLDQQGWVDVSAWLERPAHEKVNLHDLAPGLPLVVHPTGAPEGLQDWTEVLSQETCFIVESDNAVRSEWMEE
jgi:hypothetical protein